MANGTGNPGVSSAWEGGDLVFYGANGTEALRITAAGAVQVNGDAAATAPFSFPAGAGTNGQVLTSNGNGTTTWATPA